MKSFLLPFRYVVFVAFIVSNSITCSTAVWNLSLAQAAGQTLSVDGFVVFVGAAALAFIFPIILIELARQNPITACVGFELSWVAFFGVLEFCAAVALSAIGPGVMCNAGVIALTRDSCISTRVVLAFSWICTILLFGYLLALGLSAYLHKNENPQIWGCNVRRFDWCGARSYMGDDGPKSLTLPRFVEKTRPGSLIGPKPRYPAPNALYLQANIEQSIQQPQPQASAARQPAPVPAAVHNARDATAASFYPKHMQSVITSQPSFAGKPMKEIPLSSSPPPLGDWPRPSIISQPRSKRQEPSRGYTIPPVNASSNDVYSKPQPATHSTRPLANHRTTRSTSSNERRKIPPPLDLSKISNTRTRL